MASVELADLTYAVYEARRAAMRSLTEETKELGATGVLDLRLDVTREGAPTQRFASVVVTAHALGSAVRRPDAMSEPLASPSPVLNLTGAAHG